MRLSFLFAAAIAALPAVALALPGQSVADFKTWAHANAGLGPLKQQIAEMSGQPFYTAHVKGGPKDATFTANLSAGKILDETIGVDLTVANDMSKDPKLVATLLKAVYGPAVAADARGAALVGRWTLLNDDRATALYRGKRYGYEVAHAFVKVIPAAAVSDEAKYLARCAKTECGD